MAETTSSNQILAMTTQIVSSHVANNAVAVSDLAGLIQQIHQTLATVPGDAAVSERPKTAVSITGSVKPD